jgi:hypothetical protein
MHMICAAHPRRGKPKTFNFVRYCYVCMWNSNGGVVEVGTRAHECAVHARCTSLQVANLVIVRRQTPNTIVYVRNNQYEISSFEPCVENSNLHAYLLCRRDSNGGAYMEPPVPYIYIYTCARRTRRLVHARCMCISEVDDS